MNAITKLNQSQQLYKPTILVLGGYGFIGRHIVDELAKLKIPVLIGTRRKRTAVSPTNERHLRLHRLDSDLKWQEQLDGVDVIVNTVGILRQRWGETYDQVHRLAVVELANICSKRNIRLIHISALGLNNQVKSRFLSSKLQGELALAKSTADWHIVRPSLVDGDGGYGAKWFRRVAKWPMHFIPSNANGTLAPIKATDLANAVMAIALRNDNTELNSVRDRIYELGGNTTMNLRQYLAYLEPDKSLNHSDDFNLKTTTPCIRVPALMARILSHICDLLHLTPFSFGHYELLKNNNLPELNRLSELLNKDSEQKHAHQHSCSLDSLLPRCHLIKKPHRQAVQ